FALQRFVSRVACLRIPSCFPYAVTIGSLPCQLALNATSLSPKIRQAFAKLVDHSGQAISRDIGYHQAAGFDASATNRRSRARLALSSPARTHLPDRPLSPGRPVFSDPVSGRSSAG